MELSFVTRVIYPLKQVERYVSSIKKMVQINIFCPDYSVIDVNCQCK